MANQLKQEGIILSPGGVRSIWMRHTLHTKAFRLKRLEVWSAKENNILTESQVQALESAKAEKEAHGEIETHHPGFLLGQDTYYVGYIKGAASRVWWKFNIEKIGEVLQDGFEQLNHL